MMETSLHRDLKALYAGQGSRLEARLGPYRIDVISGDQLVEIQFGPLAAIRQKVQTLLKRHQVSVVKPIVARKLLVKRASKGGAILQRRMSPKKSDVWDLFDDLVHFIRVFPHPRLTLEVLLVDIEEWRYPGHGRRRLRRAGDFQVEDQRLLAIRQSYRLRTAADLACLISSPLAQPFHTRHLSQSLRIPVWTAQRVAYCLREAGATRVVGKRGNLHLYEFLHPFGLQQAGHVAAPSAG